MLAHEVVLHVTAGAAGSGLVAAQAYRLRALTVSGAWAAAACGTVLYGAGGWMWAALIAVFFATSSALTRLDAGPRGRPRRSLDRLGRRWDQVAANGGVATLAAAAYGLTGSPVAFAAGAGAIAAATADTWATEVGRWSPAPPRLVTTWAPVPHGTSGGITAAGTVGAAAGALLIAAIATLIGGSSRPVHIAAVVAGAGFSGSLLDSVLGATIENRWRWANNNTINLAATVWAVIIVLLTLRS
jgi:uncharacterized protein (TIGR00297 family)